MNTIEVDEFKFLEVSTNPNILISLKGEKNFCELNLSDKSNFLKSYFGLDGYSEFEQVHGVLIDGLDTSEINEFDGFITKEKNHAFAIKTADCIPLVMWDDKEELLCGLHCGWKGLQQGIIGKALEKNKYQNLTKSYIGPHISKNYFEVKQDLINKFLQVGEVVGLWRHKKRGGTTGGKVREVKKESKIQKKKGDFQQDQYVQKLIKSPKYKKNIHR